MALRRRRTEVSQSSSVSLEQDLVFVSSHHLAGGVLSSFCPVRPPPGRVSVMELQLWVTQLRWPAIIRRGTITVTLQEAQRHGRLTGSATESQSRRLVVCMFGTSDVLLDGTRLLFRYFHLEFLKLSK